MTLIFLISNLYLSFIISKLIRKRKVVKIWRRVNRKQSKSILRIFYKSGTWWQARDLSITHRAYLELSCVRHSDLRYCISMLGNYARDIVFKPEHITAQLCWTHKDSTGNAVHQHDRAQESQHLRTNTRNAIKEIGSEKSVHNGRSSGGPYLAGVSQGRLQFPSYVPNEASVENGQHGHGRHHAQADRSQRRRHVKL